jgi:hypothetical protein
MTTAETVTPIEVPYPAADEAQLRIALGPCRLNVRPGAQGALARGTYDDPSGLLPLRVAQEGARVSLSQGPSAERWRDMHAGVPRLELALGSEHPYSLAVEGGANDCTLDLGGLPLTALTFHQGAGRSDFDFSAPNPGGMGLLEISAGAVALEMRHLANSGFASMRVSGGAASYVLDFAGELKRDAEAQVSAGMSGVEVRVPATTAARVSSNSVLGPRGRRGSHPRAHDQGQPGPGQAQPPHPVSRARKQPMHRPVPMTLQRAGSAGDLSRSG